MLPLEKAAETAIRVCMAVKRDESVLIVFDENRKEIANNLEKAARKFAGSVKLIEVPVGKRNGEEPPANAEKEMKKHDVVVIPTTKSYSHTKARANATAAGARLASMPGITEEMMIRTMSADYLKLRKITNRLADVLDMGREVRITTEKGTDISMSIMGRKCHGRSGGIFDEKGKWGNLPDGEACIAPLEGTAKGIFFVDASMCTGRLKEGISITVKDGFAVGFEGEESKDVLKMFEGLGAEAFNIAELGIGTNDQAIITGNVLEDEKVLGTAHIALGNNKSFGGKVDVPVHIDGVFAKPDIWVDSRKIMERGKLLISGMSF